MKKLISILLITVLALSFCACGKVTKVDKKMIGKYELTKLTKDKMSYDGDDLKYLKDMGLGISLEIKGNKGVLTVQKTKSDFKIDPDKNQFIFKDAKIKYTFKNNVIKFSAPTIDMSFEFTKK